MIGDWSIFYRIKGISQDLKINKGNSNNPISAGSSSKEIHVGYTEIVVTIRSMSDITNILR